MTAESVLAPATVAASGPVPERIAAWASLRPDALAVADARGATATYRELHERSDAVAHRLTGMGAGREVIVALALEAGVELVVAMLGVLKAGAAYLPLSPSDPRDRLDLLVGDAGARLVLTDRAGAGRLTGGPAAVVDLGTLMARPVSRTVLGPVSPAALAYVIYTSGSTGRPKGVGVTHANLAAYVEQIMPVLSAVPGEIFSMVQPATFDSCLTVLYPALVGGGTLWLVPPEQATDAEWMTAHIRDDRVDHMKITPSHLAALHQAGDPAALMPRRTLLLGGEGSPWAWFAGLRRLREGCSVVNHYGPTETTVGVAALDELAPVTSPAAGTPLGPAMRNAVLYVLDDHWLPVADGEEGELCVGGATVSRGYLGRPGLTADVFVPDPFGDLPGARLYRTGDRVRRRPDGTFDFLGRADDQVKVRGFRVEPEEAAYALRGCPGVADAVVVPWPDAAGLNRLVGYVRSAADLDVDELRAHVARVLPSHLVPDSIQVVDAFPLTKHGKLDRAKLPEPVSSAPGTGSMTGTAAERAIAAIFADLLGCATVGRDDGFFDLGGHSLLVAKLISRLRTEFDVEVPVRLVFEAPTVAGIAARLDLDRGEPILPPVRPARRDAPLPASFGQQRMWFFNQFAPDSPLYNTNLSVRMLGTVDPGVLRRCVTALVDRHEVLRTRLVPGGDGVVQVIEQSPSIPFESVDLTTGADDEVEQESRRYFEAYSERPFDLTAEIPVRALYLRLADDEHLLLLSMHHVATDAPSMVVLHRELAMLYQSLRDERDSPFEPLPTQYADYASWQREMLAGAAWTRQLGYWRQQLAGLPPRVELRTDRPRPAEISPAGSRVRFGVPESLADSLRALGGSQDTTLFTVLFAGMLVALRDLTAQTDLAVGVPVAFRPRPELEATVGYFGNTVVLRNEVHGSLTFRELIRRVGTTTVQAIAHSDLPFEALVEELAPRRSFADNPLFNVMFALADEEREPVVLDDVTFQAEPVDTATAAADLAVLFQLTAEGLAGEIEYRTELFDERSMRSFASRLGQILGAAAAAPDAPIAGFVDPGCTAPLGQPAPEDLIDDAFGEDASDLGEYVAPGTDLERELCYLWAELTGNQDIGVADDFFAVGGHSLMAAQVVQRIKRRHGVSVPLRWCFDQPTVADLALRVLAAQLEGRADGRQLLDSIETKRDGDD